MSSPDIILLAENEEYALYRVKSHSNPNVSYGVDIDKVEGTCYCDCPDFQYRKQTERWGGAKLDDEDHRCKHARQVLEAIENGVPIRNLLSLAELAEVFTDG